MGAADPDPESSVVLLLLMSCVLTVNGVVIARRARQQSDAEAAAKRATGTPSSTDEMDVHAVLDFDARLEALERAQHDAVDAARWRSLVESGQVTAPAASLGSPTADARRQSVSG